MNETEDIFRRLIENDARIEERMNASDKATVIALTTIDKRLEGMNEFRAQLNQQAATFVTRDDMDMLKDQTSKFVTRAELWGFLSATVTLTVSIIGLVMKFFK